MVPINVLIIEDSEDDTLLILRELRKGGFEPFYTRVDTEEEMVAALDNQQWDIVIADYSMPRFSAPHALDILQQRDIDLPFFIVSGSIGEDVAAAAMKAGAQDYLMKNNLTRLVPAIERELQEDTLRQTQKLESLGVLAGGIAHDFNNLLVAMLGQSSLALAKLPVDSPARSHVEKVIRAAERAADLTKQMLAYSGRGRFNIKTLDINDLVSENISLLEAGIPKKVRLITQLTHGLPLIEADKGQLQQVIMNLILNAAEAIEGSNGTVTVSSCLVSGEELLTFQWPDNSRPPLHQQFVLVEVEDNGKGMDPETLSKIFDPFFTTKVTGRGLGLAAVLGIVRGHKGALKVVSDLGRGTRFRILFPSTEAAPPPPAPPAELPFNQHQQRYGTILVIDDEEPVREALVDILEDTGLMVLTAPDGETGVRTYQSHFPDIDLVILDHSMPGMTGEETFRELQLINPSAQVIISSGYDRSEVTRHFSDLGLAGFLQKPYSANQLVDEVSRNLGVELVF